MATKVISARIDEEAADLMDRVSTFLGITKKQFLEEAIRLRAEHDERKRKLEAIRRSFGAWNRDETPEETVRQFSEWREALDRERRERFEAMDAPQP